MNVSIFIGIETEHWSLQKETNDVHLERIDKFLISRLSCGKANVPPPKRDWIHFTGDLKPWGYDLSQNVSETDFRRGSNKIRLKKYVSRKINDWRATLLQVQMKANRNFTFWWNTDTSDPPLGRFSTYKHMIDHIRLKKFFKWNQYSS
jgi:hypothetical protein